MVDYFLTPDPKLILRSDGVLTRPNPDIQAREPEENELADALMSAGGIAVDTLSHAVQGRSDDIAFHARISADVVWKFQQVCEKIPMFGEWIEFANAVVELMGFDLAEDPVLRQVKVLDRRLHDFFISVDQSIYASWSATRLAMLSEIQAHTSAARETIGSIIQAGSNLSDPLTIARLAQADRDSLFAVQTFTNDIDSGYWLRPYHDRAAYVEQWGNWFDDRPPVRGDGLVWDPRGVVPTLSYAISIRVIVLKAVHGANTRNYCQEVNRLVQFLLSVQLRWGDQGLRRKLTLTNAELHLWGGFTTVPFYAGAVDVWTGTYHRIQVDYEAWNLSYALGFTTTPVAPHIQPSEFIPASEVARNITREDVDMRFPHAYREILLKQADFSFTRIRFASGLFAFSDAIKALGEICAGRDGRQIVKTYRAAMKKAKSLTKLPGGADRELEARGQLVRLLTDCVLSPDERKAGTSYIDRYLLFAELERSRDTLKELADVMRKHARRPA